MPGDSSHINSASLIAGESSNMTYKQQDQGVLPIQTRSPHLRRPNPRRRSKNSPTSGNAHKIPKFLRSLYSILQKEDSAVIAWVENQQLIPNRVTAFHILDMARFEREILPKYFKHQKFASFQRQLNNFGFRKWTKTQSSGVCTFSHNCFPPDPSALVNGLMRIANRDHWRQHRGSSCALDAIKQANRDMSKVHSVRYGECTMTLPIVAGHTMSQFCRQSEIPSPHLPKKAVINRINPMGLTVKTELGDGHVNNYFSAPRVSSNMISNRSRAPLHVPSPRVRYHGNISHQRGQPMRVGLKRFPNSNQQLSASNLNSTTYCPDSFTSGTLNHNSHYNVNFSALNQNHALSGNSSTAQDMSGFCNTNENGMNYGNLAMSYSAAKQVDPMSGLSTNYSGPFGAMTPNGIDGFGFFDAMSSWDTAPSSINTPSELVNQQLQNNTSYGTNSLVGLDLTSYPMELEFPTNHTQQYLNSHDKQSPPQVDDFAIDNLLLVE